MPSLDQAVELGAKGRETVDAGNGVHGHEADIVAVMPAYSAPGFPRPTIRCMARPQETRGGAKRSRRPKMGYALFFRRFGRGRLGGGRLDFGFLGPEARRSGDGGDGEVTDR